MCRHLVPPNAFGGTFAILHEPTHQDIHEMTRLNTTEKEERRHNSSYTQAGVSCFVGHLKLSSS